MNKEDWLKAIKCTKEELIEWLCEMYENDKLQKAIIKKYEEYTDAKMNDIWRDDKIITRVDVANDFRYIKKW